MGLREPIHISIYNFIMFGKFDSIKIGQTKEWILNNFPNPDDRIVQKRGQGFDIWRYGTIEFHFVGEELVLIFSDSIGELSGGPNVQLDKWIFEYTDKLTLLFVQNELNTHNVDYRKISSRTTSQIILRLSSGVELMFDNTQDINRLSTNDFHLIAIGLKKQTI
jgi:hypothetical protein